jgi:hypothetical protein
MRPRSAAALAQRDDVADVQRASGGGRLVSQRAAAHQLVDAQARGVEEVGGLRDADTPVGRDATEEQQRLAVERGDGLGGLRGGVRERRGECDGYRVRFLSEAGFAVSVVALSARVTACAALAEAAAPS